MAGTDTREPVTREQAVTRRVPVKNVLFIGDFPPVPAVCLGQSGGEIGGSIEAYDEAAARWALERHGVRIPIRSTPMTAWDIVVTPMPEAGSYRVWSARDP